MYLDNDACVNLCLCTCLCVCVCVCVRVHLCGFQYSSVFTPSQHCTWSFPAQMEWSVAKPTADMALPGDNSYVPKVFTVFFNPENKHEISRLHTPAGLVAWHQPSQYFADPKVCRTSVW